MISATSAAVAVARVGTACTSRQEVNVSLDNVEAALRRRQPGDPVHSNHPTPSRRERQRVEQAPWAAVFRPGQLARLARVHVLGDVDVLSYPEGKAANK